MTGPEIHYGVIASGNTLIKDAIVRDSLAGQLRQDAPIVCFEMEAACLMNSFPCLVVRGICDYADSHKQDHFQRYASITAAGFAKEFLTYVPSGEVVKFVKEIQLQKREDAVQDFLQALYTCPYAERKDRNRDHVEGTCQWFTHHPLFHQWKANDSSSLLWVSADPGCGKSVLAKYLVDDASSIIGHNVVCYFFFKDDFEEQKSSATAMCAFLRQLFLSQPHLLKDEVLRKFKQDGVRLFRNFRDLWDIFVSAAEDSAAGEIVGILDALDECQDDDRVQLIKALCRLDNRESESRLKLLITSRPYDSIQRAFQGVIDGISIIHLSGEDEREAEQISREINLVIQYRVRHLGIEKCLEEDEQDFLTKELTSVLHRTYLWVYLTLDVVQNTPGFTKGNVRRVVRDIPRTVDDAYERILRRSANEKLAKHLLHIVVAAKRPLSLEEMSTALAIGQNQSSKSIKDLEEYVEPQSRFRKTVRDWCGLFIIIVDSHIYLLHQTAKEFLVREDQATVSNTLPVKRTHDESDELDSSTTLKWKKSLRPADSHRLLARLCLLYLSLDDFTKTLSSSMDYYTEIRLRAYAVSNWAFHFR